MKKGALILFVVIVFLFFRDNIPYISSQIPLAASIMVLAVSYLLFIVMRVASNIGRYLLAFSIPIANVLFSFFNTSDGTLEATMYTFFQLFIWAFVCEYILKMKDRGFIRWLAIIIFVSVIITAITTYLGCLALPGASRDMASGLRFDRDAMAIYTKMNIGGFAFAYLLVLLLPLLFDTLRFRSSRLISRLLVIALIILFYVTIYTTEYSTAILLSIVAVLILFLPQSLTRRNTAFVFAGIGLAIIIISSFLPGILMYFSSSTDSYTVSIRMEELGHITSGQAGYGDAQGRIDLMLLSLNNFFEHFFLGSGNSGGGHSYILDTMSKYGVWGLILVILQFSSLFKISVKPYVGTKYHTIFLLVYVMNFLLCIFNTVCFYNVFFVFLPLYYRLLATSASSSQLERTA